MFTSMLLLVSSVCAFQDAGAARPDDASGTPSAPAVTAPAPAAAPAQTAESVRAYLMEAEGQLYDPQAAGLKSVEFDAPVIEPGLGDVGTVHVAWNAGAEPTARFVQKEGLQLPPGIPPGILDKKGEQIGRQFLDSMLNRPISPLLRTSVATMGTPEGGLVKVNFDSEEAAKQGVKEQAFLFDDNGLLQKSVMVLDMAAMGAPGMTMPVNQFYTWKPVTTGSDLLIGDTMTAEADFGFMGKQKTVIQFTNRSVDNVVLITAMTMTSEAPGGTGGTQAIEATNLVVNGKPAPAVDAPAAAPAGG